MVKYANMLMSVTIIATYSSFRMSPRTLNSVEIRHRYDNIREHQHI
jgi:hypothetical protein